MPADLPNNCRHNVVHCLNQHELIRKYRCDACAGVMMCACDEDFGRRFLFHQLKSGTELTTQRRVRVTLGFQPKICAECRGLPAEPAPAAEIHGRTSKIRRYYWRELFFGTRRRTSAWDETHPNATKLERHAAHEAIEKLVLEETKALHATAPKYAFSEPSQAEILERYRVEVVAIEADHVQAAKKGEVIRNKHGEAVSPEAFMADLYEAQGWAVMPLESRPFHALFGVMMWLVIQDATDPQVRMAGFGNRAAHEAGQRPPPPIWTLLPSDFGSQGYSIRRKAAIDRHLAKLPLDRDELLWTFDYWRPMSSDLRQYLWAHRDADADRARRLMEVIPATRIISILQYLVQSYWNNYLGWPDLLLYRQGEFLLAEVKSSGDRLSQDQKRWIGDNHDVLGLPFRLIKLCKPRATRRKATAGNRIRSDGGR